MITYRSLTSSDFIPLYECFLKAFSDYQVDMRMSEQQFEQRLTRDGVQPDISAAAFDDENMIGFYINALGMWQGKQTAYDAGTGVIREYRQRGIAKELFTFLVARLKEIGVAQYLLEVLSANERAVSLYRKLGFVETRTLAVLRSEHALEAVDDLEGVSIRRIEQADWTFFESFWDGHPSWQNSIAAVERVADQRVMLGAYIEDKCVGYGVVFRPAGTLLQLAVAREYRRRGIGRRILARLCKDEVVKVNNVDEELKETLAFFEANGFKSVLTQYEMVKIF